MIEQWLVTKELEGMAARTRNTYLHAINGFLNWALSAHRIVKNPLSKIPKANERADRRLQRRAMTEAEFLRLLYVARWRPLAEYGRPKVNKPHEQRKRSRDTWAKKPLTFENLKEAVRVSRERLRNNPAFIEELERLGDERRLIYKTLVLTGLRKNELASITVGQLHLDDKTPYLMLNASDEKNRTGSHIPVRGDLAVELSGWIAKKHHSLNSQGSQFQEKLFRVPNELAKILNRDLQVAGIAKTNEQGRRLDVHALRTTFGTWLSKSGVSPRTAQAAMRHSDIDLTMQVYTDPKLLDLSEAINSLPSLKENSQPAAQSGATDGSTVPPYVPLTVPQNAFIQGQSQSQIGKEYTSEKMGIEIVSHCEVKKYDQQSQDVKKSKKTGDRDRTDDAQLGIAELITWHIHVRPTFFGAFCELCATWNGKWLLACSVLPRPPANYFSGHAIARLFVVPQVILQSLSAVTVPFQPG